ncbi:hypothetical protein B0T22DRAFT_117331 [Podospora appendiculata]|uniref:Uncharacterized protein n=1 Tax=Podospora appendiculata TaxID=314037 RepID=A0AAE0XM03_9PEZI|nr:hypothetical protein B0T22DRAFT_117331 [Podospora appendiculata]
MISIRGGWALGFVALGYQACWVCLVSALIRFMFHWDSIVRKSVGSCGGSWSPDLYTGVLITCTGLFQWWAIIYGTGTWTGTNRLLVLFCHSGTIFVFWFPFSAWCMLGYLGFFT